MSTPPAPSFVELLDRLARHVSTLVQHELALARAELALSVRGLTTSAVAVVAGGVLAVIGVLALVAALILILMALGWPAWVSAIVVAVVFLGAGGVAVKWGLGHLKTVSVVPAETIASLKEDVEWLKTQLTK